MINRDAKRQAILDAAYRLFRTHGFDGTSISKITAQVGGSKATIYSHFLSKEELFVECMTAAVEGHITGAIVQLDVAGTDPGAALREFGEKILSFGSSPDMVAVRRLIIAEASRSGIGKLFFAKILALRTHVAALLSKFMVSGALRPDDADFAASQLRALLELNSSSPCCCTCGKIRRMKRRLRWRPIVPLPSLSRPTSLTDDRTKAGRCIHEGMEGALRRNARFLYRLDIHLWPRKTVLIGSV